MHVLVAWAAFGAIAVIGIPAGMVLGVQTAYSDYRFVPPVQHIVLFLLVVTIGATFVVAIASLLFMGQTYDPEIVKAGLWSIFIFDFLALLLSRKRPVTHFLRSIDGMRFAIPARSFWRNAEVSRLRGSGGVFGAIVSINPVAARSEVSSPSAAVTIRSSTEAGAFWFDGKAWVEHRDEMTKIGYENPYQILTGPRYSKSGPSKISSTYYVRLDNNGNLSRIILISHSQFRCETVENGFFLSISGSHPATAAEIDAVVVETVELLDAWRVHKTLLSELKYHWSRMLRI